jgi:CheY-like chemotaxis protein
MLVYVFLGVLVGAFAFVFVLAFALIQGFSPWYAVLAYSGVGTGTMVLLALVLPRLAAQQAGKSRSDEDVAGSAASTAGDAPVAAHAEPALSPAAPTGLRILAVDDDPFIRELLPMIAAKTTCSEMTTVSSGKDALDRIAAAIQGFDCILLDINMPGMDGIELCARIRSLPSCKDVPVIMLTAMSDRDHLERAFRAGASDYVSKPFDIIEFGERLNVAQAQVAGTTPLGTGDVATARPARMQQGDPLQLDRIAGLPSFIRYDALRNYLDRLAGSALVDTYVMSVVVSQSAQHDAAADRCQDSPDMAAVARAIDTVFTEAGYLSAYAGHGTFALVSKAALLPGAETVEADIEEVLQQIAVAQGAPAARAMSLSVGLAVRPERRRDNRANRALETAMRLARDRADARTDAEPQRSPRVFGRGRPS